MTHYYYVASDQLIGSWNGSVSFIESGFISISGFDYPVQLETQSLEKEWELRELLQFIRQHTADYKVCTVQIANVLNSNKVELAVEKKSNILLHEIEHPRQLLLEEGHLLTIKKVPIFTEES